MQDSQQNSPSGEPESDEGRRGFLGKAAAVAMTGGLVAGYVTFASQAARFLYPADAGRKSWQFVCTLDRLAVGETMPFTMPSGAKVVVARRSEEDAAESFIALSSICPHLGCKVFWEGGNNRFFCPCHNGAFDAEGAPTEGPPAAANQSLAQFPLMVEGNLLLIEVPLDQVDVSTPGGSA